MTQLEQLDKRISRNHPDEKIQKAKEEQNKQTKALYRAMSIILSNKQAEFTSTLSTLEALSPLKIMERGYSLTYNEKGNLVKSVQHVDVKDHVKITLADGTLNCQVVEKEE